ncbi:MAG: hypothetical protein AB1659_10545 [Thermodesulfobacteriota bacterium]
MTGDKEKSRRLMALFLLGSVLFNYPVLSLFNLNLLCFGIPVLYVYIFSIWIALIVITIRITRYSQKSDQDQPRI